MLDCKYSEIQEKIILNASNVLMSQPLPHSLLPLETNRIIYNERLLPGITKVLQIGEDFPMLNISPRDLGTFFQNRTQRLAMINQMVQVFVYEDMGD